MTKNDEFEKSEVCLFAITRPDVNVRASLTNSAQAD